MRILRTLAVFLLVAAATCFSQAATHSATLTISDADFATNPTMLFTVYRANGACTTGMTFAKLGTTSTLSYVDSTIALSTPYCYYVTATVSGQTSPNSPLAGGMLMSLQMPSFTITFQ